MVFLFSARVQAQMFMTLPFNEQGISITSGWLYDDGSQHRGIDYAIGAPPESFPIVSVAAGNAVVVLDDGGKSNKSGYGNFVYIEHDRFDPVSLRYFTLYAHLRSGRFSALKC
jgi:murein DD-endopeptidase MepM/ murein hydrolase activator NlpD